jgi:hypothetical protein
LIALGWLPAGSNSLTISNGFDIFCMGFAIFYIGLDII